MSFKCPKIENKHDKKWFQYNWRFAKLVPENQPLFAAGKSAKLKYSTISDFEMSSDQNSKSAVFNNFCNLLLCKMVLWIG